MGTETVCGVDVHGSVAVAHLRSGGVPGETREFDTTARSLRELREWLHGQGCSRVGMEATGVSWRPIYRILEGSSVSPWPTRRTSR